MYKESEGVVIIKKCKIHQTFLTLAKEWEDVTRGRKPPFNYEEFQNFIYSYTLGLEQSYPLNTPITREYEPYIRVLHFSVAYNHYIYERLCALLTGGGIYPNGKFRVERRPDFDLLILQLWKQRNFTLDNLVRSFCIGREFQAIQQLRIYMESCLQLFLFLTEPRALTQFLADDIDEEEYKKQWWKYLSPSKVEKRIRKNKQNVLNEEKERGIVWGDIRKEEPGNNLDHTKKITDKCNDYIHFKKKALFFHSFENQNSRFRLGLSGDFSEVSNATLVNIIESVSYTTEWIEKAIGCHSLLFQVRSENKDEQDAEFLHFLHSGFALKLTFNGMYDFADAT